MEKIPFNRPHVVGTEFGYIEQAIASGKLSGNGVFAERCANWLEERIGAERAFITPSCTAALEMAALLAGVGPGDEVIMPSFTFVSTATAFVQAGGAPVFVDVDEDTLNIDPRRVEAAITERTKAIAVVHYAGVGCDMQRIVELAQSRGLVVIEDAAHGLLSQLDGRPLGSFGELATLSFHETKAVHSGEGGALLVNAQELIERAEIVQEKGTNRSLFFRGEVDRYTWVDVGSSYLLSEVAAAFLWAQLERAEELTARRLAIWRAYHDAFAELEQRQLVRRPVVPAGATHNAHMYHLLLPSRAQRDALIDSLGAQGVHAVFHYVPLHSSPAGRRFGRAAGELPVTDDVSDRIVRLPLWVDMPGKAIERVIGAVRDTLAASAA